MFRLTATTEFGNSVYKETALSTVPSKPSYLDYYIEKSLYSFNPNQPLHFFIKTQGITSFNPANLQYTYSDPLALASSGVGFSEHLTLGYIKVKILSPPDLASFQITIKYGTEDNGLILDFHRIKTIQPHLILMPSILKEGLAHQKILLEGSMDSSSTVKVYCRQWSTARSCGDD